MTHPDRPAASTCDAGPELAFGGVVGADASALAAFVEITEIAPTLAAEIGSPAASTSTHSSTGSEARRPANSHALEARLSAVRALRRLERAGFAAGREAPTGVTGNGVDRAGGRGGAGSGGRAP